MIYTVDINRVQIEIVKFLPLGISDGIELGWSEGISFEMR